MQSHKAQLLRCLRMLRSTYPNHPAAIFADRGRKGMFCILPLRSKHSTTQLTRAMRHRTVGSLGLVPIERTVELVSVALFPSDYLARSSGLWSTAHATASSGYSLPQYEQCLIDDYSGFGRRFTFGAFWLANGLPSTPIFALVTCQRAKFATNSSSKFSPPKAMFVGLPR